MMAVEEQLAELAMMDKQQLKDRWAALTGRHPPRASTGLLRLALAYEMQARAFGRLPKSAIKQLERGAASPASQLCPGTRLAREHGGKVHIVTIGEDHRIEWNGRQWRSLSEVARAITGTRWSGPAFFGLRAKKLAA